MNKKEAIIDYLTFVFEKPICELDYNSDYQLLIAIALSAQTTDKKVNIVTKELFTKYDNIESLSNAKKEDIEKIIKPLGLSNKKSESVIDIANNFLNGFDSKNRAELECIKGVGRKTASVFLSEYYDIPSFAVDTHVHRFAKRFSICNQSDNVLVAEEKLKAFFDIDTWNEMNLRIILFGRYICKSRNPNCTGCKLKEYCNYNN